MWHGEAGEAGYDAGVQTMTTLNVAERRHARISPSGFERAEACTMSVRLSAQAPTTATDLIYLIGTAAPCRP